jgi:hypothetical protein
LTGVVPFLPFHVPPVTWAGWPSCIGAERPSAADSQVEIGPRVVYNHEADNENSAGTQSHVEDLDFGSMLSSLKAGHGRSGCWWMGRELRVSVVRTFVPRIFQATIADGNDYIYPSIVTITHAGLERQSDALLEFPRIRQLKGKV